MSGNGSGRKRKRNTAGVPTDVQFPDPGQYTNTINALQPALPIVFKPSNIQFNADGTSSIPGGTTGGSLTLTNLNAQLVTGTAPNQTTSSWPPPSGNVVLTYPNTTDTVVGRNTADVLQNKKLDGLTCTIVDDSDNTKSIRFDPSLNSTATRLLLRAQQTTTQSLSFPNISGADTVTTNAAPQTLGNKTLTTPVMTLPLIEDSTDTTKQLAFSLSGNSTTKTLTLATAQTTNATLNVPNVATGDTLLTSGTFSGVTAAGNNTFTGTNTFQDTKLSVVNTSDATKTAVFDLSGQTTGTTLTLKTAQSTSQTLNIPNIGATDTLPTIKATNSFTGGNTFRDTFFQIGANADTSKSLKFSTVNNTTGTGSLTIRTNQTTVKTVDIPDIGTGDSIATLNTTQTFTNKTLTSPSITTPTVTSGTSTFPSSTTIDGSGNVVIGAGQLQLTAGATPNKIKWSTADGHDQSLVSGAPGSNGSVITLPSVVTDTLVSKTSFDTLTNKTLTSPTVTSTATFTGQINNTYTGGALLANGGVTVGQSSGAQGYVFFYTGTGGNYTALTNNTGSIVSPVYLPPSACTLVGDSCVQTLTNKALTTPNITAPTITTGLTFSGANQSQLGAYETTSVTVTPTNGMASGTGSLTIYLSRVGKAVTASFADINNFQLTAGAALAFAAGSIPARFQPVVAGRFHNLVNNGVAVSSAAFLLATDGSLTFYVDTALNSFNNVNTYYLANLGVGWNTA